MYRGQPYTPPPKWCRYCKGTGKITDPTVTRVPHDCTSCNGTGLEGDPRFLLIALLIWMLILGGLFVAALFIKYS